MTVLVRDGEFDSPDGFEGPKRASRETMAIYVKADPKAGQSKGDWIVTTDGGRTISRHRKKSRAMEVARREAKKRGESVRFQNARTGTWNQGPSY